MVDLLGVGPGTDTRPSTEAPALPSFCSGTCTGPTWRLGVSSPEAPLAVTVPRTCLVFDGSESFEGVQPMYFVARPLAGMVGCFQKVRVFRRKTTETKCRFPYRKPKVSTKRDLSKTRLKTQVPGVKPVGCTSHRPLPELSSLSQEEAG